MRKVKFLTNIGSIVTSVTIWPSLEQLILSAALVLAGYLVDAVVKYVKKKIDEKLECEDVPDH